MVKNCRDCFHFHICYQCGINVGGLTACSEGVNNNNIIILPRINDVVYLVSQPTDRVVQCTVKNININEKGTEISLLTKEQVPFVTVNELFNSIFFTEDEAIKKLELCRKNSESSEINK